ncbi:hypothetical protein [Argonema antarcticum]|uniref:hypothetical protein n=1 Tax=Argonema antarcticum TaxID=2942763 RepID=UPI002012F463|nr:hypothetical protein [Argonema antarcticum]MCL1470678.1 hypothetical protein [Argonema antarcticum A004/B2]
MLIYSKIRNNTEILPELARSLFFNNFSALMQRLGRGLYKRSHHVAFVNLF